MNLRRFLLFVVALPVVVLAQGCALFLIGAAAGAAAGTVSYVGNELRVTQEVGVNRAWDAANAAVGELEFSATASKSHKDATGGMLYARNARSQEIKIELFRQSDRMTEIRVRVGVFDTKANRAMAQLVYDKMKTRF